MKELILSKALRLILGSNTMESDIVKNHENVIIFELTLHGVRADLSSVIGKGILSKEKSQC